MQVHVTKAHMHKARAERAKGARLTKCCPIAQALREVWPEATVGLEFCYMTDEDDSPLYALPEAAKRFIEAWDEKPTDIPEFTFELEIPTSAD